MTKETFCVWCWKKISMPDKFNECKHKPVCSWTCYFAEVYFCKYWEEVEKQERSEQ